MHFKPIRGENPLKGCVFQFHNKFFKIMEDAQSRVFRNRKIEVRVNSSGAIRAFLDNFELKVAPLETIRQPVISQAIPIENLAGMRRRWVPSAAHPWRHMSYGRRGVLFKK